MGLSEQEAVIRHTRGLGNDYKLKTSRSYLDILRANLFTFFNMVLFLLGIVLVLMDKPEEAIITSGVVLMNVLISVIQELRAKRKLDHIAFLTQPKARVIRDGEPQLINPSRIVVGDLLVLETGDQIVVDGQVVGPGKLNVDESQLSGEANLIPKKHGDPVYSGSFCVSGSAKYIAQKVGKDSMANQLASEARQFSWEYTPLQREVNLIIRVLLAVVTFFLTLHVIDALLGKISPLESIQAASVLFGMAPNSLFLMIVVAYTWGAVRIAAKGALVQQANSIESLCNVDVLCLDKTGTLTTNRLKLDKLITINRKAMERLPLDLHQLLGTYARMQASPNRTSQAIIDAYPGDRLNVIGEVQFTSHLSWSALTFDDQKLKGTFFLGAPEKLAAHLDEAEIALNEPGSSLNMWIDKHTGLGLRVLLFAYSPRMDVIHENSSDPYLPEGLIPLCLLCFSDELRTNTKDTLKNYAGLGVRLKIISGDSPATTLALAKQAGLDELNGELSTISGYELEKMDQLAFTQAAMDFDIFGRISPQMKERLVVALRDSGCYVAMTGDGVNDVMALKKANIGIAMQSGSPATRSVADMILLNDSFSVLPKAFTEGQRILNGMQDILKLYLTRILYFAILVAAIGWLNGTSPFTPKGNSFLSVLTLATPAFALALWAHPGQVPRGSLTRRLIHFIVPAAIISSAAGLCVYLYFLITSEDLQYAQLTLLYTMSIIGILLIIFVEPPTKAWVSGDELSGDWRPTILAVSLGILFVVCLAVPQIRDLYELELLHSSTDYLIILGVVIAWFILVRTAWRRRLLDKYLKVDLGGPRIK